MRTSWGGSKRTSKCTILSTTLFFFLLNNLSVLLVKLQPACDTINLQQNSCHKLFNSLTATTLRNITTSR